MQDSYGRIIDYLRISITDRCNLACFYCMPENGCHFERRQLLSYERITEISAVAVHDFGFRKIRITGGEPLMRRDVVKLITMLGVLKSPGALEELAMTTNGVLLAKLAQDLRAAGLDSVNVSLDTLDERLYAAITGGGKLAGVMDGVRAAIAAGLRVKINTVVLLPEDQVATGGTAQDIDAVRTFAKSLGADHQCIARYHLDHRKQDPENAGISRLSSCVACNRLRLLSDSTLKPCLHADISVPVDFGDIAGSFCKAIDRKPAHGTVCTQKALVQIGG